ncbi:MAG: hypothetical protein AAGE52_20930 [Myxococcota bacterium]
MRILAFFLVVSAGCASGNAGRTDSGPARDSAIPDSATTDAAVDTGGCAMTCAPGETCRDGVCMMVDCGPDNPCPVGESCCDGTCSSLPNDPLNCGACGRTCDSRGTQCQSGQCRCGDGPQCTEPEVCCTEGCVNPQTDANNCGACGRACEDGQICEEGDCVVPPCMPACDVGETCDATTMMCRCGAGPACADGESCCGGTCIGTQADNANCGACGNVCMGATVCIAGGCTTDIPCEPACAVGETCMAGSCRCGAGPACAGATQCCAGSCIDTNSSIANCGACGRVCSGTDQCCSGTCINTSNNIDHCGRCNNDCDGDTADGCTGGTCTCGGGSECLIACAPLIGCFPL